MQAHLEDIFPFSKNCTFYPFKNYPLLLPSHNCIIITMFSFQGTFWASKETQWSFTFVELQSISFKKWWAKMDSNHRPHDYQSCALASWAIGPFRLLLVEISGIEPLTSCLQGRRSPSWAKPPFIFHYLGTHLSVPSKLNNAKCQTHFLTVGRYK